MKRKIAVLPVVFVSLALLLPQGVAAQGGTSLGSSGSSKGASTGTGTGTGSGDAAHPGWRVLEPLQKVNALKCQANPVQCQCPPDTQKTTFYEASGWYKVSRFLLMCVPVCPAGKLLRKKPDVEKAGEVSYICEDPVSYDDLPGD